MSRAPHNTPVEAQLDATKLSTDKLTEQFFEVATELANHIWPKQPTPATS